ncbi:MAG: hypothetical protein AAFQ23_04140 [Cyanobacteria bacterium J06623_1]
MSERLDRIEAKLEALADNQITLQNNIDVMTQTVAQNSTTCRELTQEINASVADLVSMIGQIAETGEENRQEIRRIWEYLLGQSGNGNGRSSQE